MNPEEIVSTESEKLLKQNSLFSGQLLVFEKNENSGLVQKVLPCNEEFFDKLFNQAFWQLYNELGLSTMPFECNYLNFIGNEMFFCKNTAERFLKNIGLEKKFVFSNGKILEKKNPSIDNLVFLAAMPFELAKNAFGLSTAAFKINSELKSFEDHYNNSLSFWKKNRIIDNTIAVSLQAMAGAIESMRFSLFSSLAFSLKMPLRDSFATKRNLLKEMVLLSASASNEELKDNAGFFSMSPYDISRAYLEENNFLSDFLGKMPFPTEPHYIIRENAKLCCAMNLSVLRKCFLKAGELKELSRDVFFLKPTELPLAFSDIKETEKTCAKRKKEFEENKKTILPTRIALQGKTIFFETEQEEKEIHGTSVGAQKTAEGKLVFVESTRDFGKAKKGDILFSKTFSPELVVLYDKCSGIVSTTGSMLGHSAIVAREKGLPCIVQLKGAGKLSEGMIVRIDGNTGKITML